MSGGVDKEFRPMRIVYYNHTGVVSGAEKMLLLALENVPSFGYEVKLVCPSEGTLASSARQLRVETYATAPLRARYTYNPVSLLRYLFSIGHSILELRRTFRSLRPDLIQANTVRAGIVATLATLGTKTPIIWHCHDILPKHPMTYVVRKLAYSTPRIRIVTCSEAAKNSISGFSSRDTEPTVIYNGIHTENYKPDKLARTEVREELHIASETVVVGMVGQITPRKGQLLVVRALAALRSSGANAKLVIIGAPLFNRDHEYFDRLKREVARLGLSDFVHFLGQRSDAPRMMQAFDVLVLNSTVEPFALVVVEAMTMRKPVIATRSGGAAELVRHGYNGELVEVGDERELVQAMQRLINSSELRDVYAQCAGEVAERRFTVKRYIAQWLALYADTPVPTRTLGGNDAEVIEMQPVSALREGKAL